MRRLLLLFGLVIIYSTSVYAQKKISITTEEKEAAVAYQMELEKIYNVKRGERPPIDLTKIEDRAFEPGKVRIKLRPYMHKYLDKRFIYSGDKGFVETGYEPFDNINRKIQAKRYERRLDQLYEAPNPGKVIEYKERHRAWGFHLEREIQFDENIDVKEVIKMFAALEDVEYAEPVYKIRLIEPVFVNQERKSFKEAFENKTEGKSKSNLRNTKLTPNDPDYDLQYGYPLINAPEAWEITTGNPNIIVAVIDQGIQYDHPDLAANMWPGFGPEGAGTIPGYHGTHVGGTVAAVSDNGVGVAGCAGGDGTANSGVKLMTCDMFNGSYAGDDDLLQMYAADNDAMISQNSWGYTTVNTYNQSSLDAIDYFNTNGGGTALAGGITIFAAGNDNDNGNWWPGCYTEVLAVASTDMTDTKSGFSNYGTWVDISAPGSDIYSTSGVNDPYIDDTYGYMSGTSMACPHVSGIASAIVSITEGLMTNAELRTLLLESVIDHYPNNPGYIGELGSGRIDFNMAAAGGDVVAGALPGPSNLDAVATSQTAIDVTWTLNEFGDDILLAYVPEGEAFGTPTNGVTYSANDVLPGGGTVLYVGNLTSYSHTGLSASTEYRYRAYSIAATGTSEYNAGDYSNPSSTTEWTQCGSSSLPFYENFNNGVPIICGTIEDNDGDGQNWYASMSDSETVGGSGGAAAFSNSWNSVALNPDNWLITPNLAVNHEQVDISFWVKPFSSWVAEKFSVYISTTGNSPADFTTELYVDTLSSQAWKKINIDVTAAMGDLSGQNIYIAIRHWDCSDQERLIIDDLNIYETITGYTVSGNLNYANTATTAIPSETVKLMDGASEVASTSTDGSGHYEFTGIANGTYTIEPSGSLLWDGVTAADITLYKQHIAGVGGTVLTGLPFASGDVSNNGTLSVMDLTIISQRIVNYIASFGVGDWTYSDGVITVLDADATKNIEGIVFGDGNASYYGAKSLQPIQLNTENILYIEEDEIFEIPVFMGTSVQELTSVTLTLEYDSDAIEISELISNTNPGDWVWKVEDGVVRIMYSSLNPVDFQKGDFLFSLKTVPQNISNSIQAITGASGEFADFSHNILSSIELTAPALAPGQTTGVMNLTESLMIYPNPAKTHIKVLNAEGANLTIYNAYGSMAAERKAIQNVEQIDISYLSSGTYFVKISKNNETIMRKLTILK